MKKSELLMIRSQICEVLEDEKEHVEGYLKLSKELLHSYYAHDMTGEQFEDFSVEDSKEDIKFHETKIKMLVDLIDQIYNYPLGE